MRKFLTTGLALALVISGGVILSHVPKALTAHIDRVANIPSEASTDVHNLILDTMLSVGVFKLHRLA